MVAVPEARMGRILVVLVGLVFVGVGAWALVDVRGIASFLGVTPAGPGSELELRAMYGGLEIGLGLFLLWCAANKSTLRIGLLCTAATVGGLGLVRIVGIMMDPNQPSMQLLFALAELAATALVVIEIVRSRGT
jgi:hypothetical protein